jgi:pyruvate dehydrogenase E1 component alpha subunit
MITKAQLVGFYEQMLRIMLWEQKLLWLLDEGKVSGFYHAGRGQEAVNVGGCAPLRPDDYIMYGHRGCGHMIAKGLSLKQIYGDFMGNMAGTTKGLGAGIVHIAWPELGILGQSGTVGGCFPIAAGAAFSAKYRGTDQVCVCFFGDGTSNRGTFHEAANAASIWKLPVVWLCENNGYAISMSVERSTAVKNIADRAAGYGMPGVVVDGMDVVAVYEAVAQAVDRARRGEGPTLIEAKCYRFRGHFEGDPQPYRSAEELELWKKRDPIESLASKLISKKIKSKDELEAIRSRILKEVEAAADEAAKAPGPTRERLFEGIYA